MNKSSKHRTDVIEALLVNVRAASALAIAYSTAWEGLVMPKVGQKRVRLPGYVPYIGDEYFHSRGNGHRILVYALSQNLHEDKGPCPRWAVDWASGGGSETLNRQNAEFARSGYAMMYPFDTGHLPILCTFLRHVLRGNSTVDHESIYSKIAATNLSKFSFRKGTRTTDNRDCLNRCWRWFSVPEIVQLQPDWVLCAGNVCYGIVRKGVEDLKSAGIAGPRVVKVAFPSLQVINRYYRNENRDVTRDEKSLRRLLSARDVCRNVEQKLTVKGVLKRDWYYFARMYDSIVEQVARS